MVAEPIVPEPHAGLLVSSTTAARHVSAANEYWRGVSRREPCPICGYTRWCELSTDGQWAHCMRESNGPEWSWRQGGYLYRISDGSASVETVMRAPRTPAPSMPTATLADRQTRDAVYRALLAACPLTAEHRAWLTGPANGLPDAELHRYGSMPGMFDRSPLVTPLVQAFGFDTLRCVPGFVEQGGRLRLYGAGKGTGVLHAITDDDGLIAAIWVRLDDPDEEGARYRPLTSNQREKRIDGPSPGSPVNVVRPSSVSDTHTLLITEGPRKAHIAALHTGLVTLGCTSVSTWRAALEIVERAIDESDVTTVIIAFDADDPAKTRTLQNVDKHRSALAAELAAMGCAVRLACWNHANGKGIDDLLLAGQSYRLEVYRPDRAMPGATGEPLVAPFATTATNTDDESGAEGAMVCVAPPVLSVLLREAAMTATLRRQVALLRTKYQRQAALSHDGRIQCGDKALAAAIWHRCPLPQPGQEAEWTRMSLAAMARATGQGTTTISNKLRDLKSMGLIDFETRRIAADTSAIFVKPGTLPASHLTKADIKALATRRAGDNARHKLCPACRRGDLHPVSYQCGHCGTVCTVEEAEQAAERHEQEQRAVEHDGQVVDPLTGEILDPIPAVVTGDDGGANEPGRQPRLTDSVSRLRNNVPMFTDSVSREAEPAQRCPPLAPMVLWDDAEAERPWAEAQQRAESPQKEKDLEMEDICAIDEDDSDGIALSVCAREPAYRAICASGQRTPTGAAIGETTIWP